MYSGLGTCTTGSFAKTSRIVSRGLWEFSFKISLRLLHYKDFQVTELGNKDGKCKHLLLSTLQVSLQFSCVNFFLYCCIHLLKPLVMFVWRMSMVLRGYTELSSCAYCEISDSEFRGAHNIIWGKFGSNYSVVLLIEYSCIASLVPCQQHIYHWSSKICGLLCDAVLEHKSMTFISFS